MFDLPLDQRPPDPPHLNVDGLPTGDRRRGESIQKYLNQLHDHSRRYTEAQILAKLCTALVYTAAKEDRDTVFDTVFPGWMHLAGQAAALSARNYWKALEGLEGLPGSIPTWRDLVDLSEFKRAKREFGLRFPTVDKVRHSIAHPEFYSKPEMNMMPDGPAAPREAFSGYWTTFEGDLVECELTDEAAKFIAGNAAKVFSAFERLRRPAPEESAPER